MIPCYVSGKGMHATQTTWSFKTMLIEVLEASRAGYDTRYRYYRRRFPDMAPGELARMVCDPVESYDRDWPGYLAKRCHQVDEVQAVTEFMLERDRLFREEARVAIYCYDEAGFGSGVNTLRFLHSGKPVLGFYNANPGNSTLNVSNLLQLEIEYPGRFTLERYQSTAEVPEQVLAWLERLSNSPHPCTDPPVDRPPRSGGG